jgi:hypothetical protein
MNAATTRKPISPANTVFLTESLPSVASTVVCCTTVNGSGSAI